MGRKRHKGNPVNGWVNLDKPTGLTSTQALGKVRRYMNAGKAGHAGTLDPLATGILPIALGEATKTIPYVQDAIKSYQFTVKWGAQSNTDDSEGEIIATSDLRPSEDAITALLPNYTGEITQTPPQFSAIKIDGQRAYDLARKGEDVKIKSRTVYIESLTLDEHTADESVFTVVCGKGTYVRSLARDFGANLGCYGHIIALRRLSVGGFRENDAISLDKLQQMYDSAATVDGTQVLETVEAEQPLDYLLPIETALDDILAIPLNDNEVATLRCGQSLSFISKGDFHRVEGMNGEIALAVHDDHPVGIVSIEGPTVKTVRLFNL